MSDNYLQHHGVKGMKWGVRRYQNADGSLTAAGRSRYGVKKEAKREFKQTMRGARSELGAAYDKADKNYEKHKNVSKYNRENVEAVDKYNATKKQAKADYKKYMSDAKTASYQQKQRNRLKGASDRLNSISNKKNVKEKDMYKIYGEIESILTYSKRGNKKAEAFAIKAIDEIDRQLYQTGKKPTYDLNKVNEFIDRALQAIDDER